MLTGRLSRDARTLVQRSFQGREYFSCLTGSILDSRQPRPTSDIDIVVVLPDDIVVTDAVRLRVAFTRRYVQLHQAHNRTPDLDWPGEVLYLRDLHDALEGATFGPVDHPDQLPPLCSPNLPYRYWVSMIATGRPITGTRAFEHYAISCAKLIMQHAATYARSVWSAKICGTVEQYWVDQWCLPRPGSESRTRRLLSHAGVSSTVDNRMGRATKTPSNLPVLEQEADQWRSIARICLNHLESS